MFEKIVALFERMVIALETIAKAPAVCANVQQPFPTVTETKPKSPAPPAANTAQTTTAAKASPFMPVPPTQERQEQPLTREQVGNALVALATSKGRDAAIAVLAQFSATQMKDVKEADYANLFAAIKKAAA